VRIGVTAPAQVLVHRREVYDAVRAANQTAAQACCRRWRTCRPAAAAAAARARGVSRAAVALGGRPAAMAASRPKRALARPARVGDGAVWPVLEHARLTRTLPGLVLRRPAAPSPADLRRRARWRLCCAERYPRRTSPAPRSSSAACWRCRRRHRHAHVCFAFTDAPDLAAALAARGFLLDPHEYLTRPLAGAPAARRPGRAWDVRDLDATAELFRASYPAGDPGRPFAPYSRPAEWLRYVADLVLGQGCGRFRPSLSIAVPGPGGTLDAAAIVTDLGAGTAHLAQLAVRPGLRGAGLGAAMLASLSASCLAAGFTRLSLLVGASNTTARRLYARAGFTPCAWFVSTTRAGRAGETRRSTAA
jgi:GNAT superfamily N-acetyltransferase